MNWDLVHKTTTRRNQTVWLQQDWVSGGCAAGAMAQSPPSGRPHWPGPAGLGSGAASRPGCSWLRAKSQPPGGKSPEWTSLHQQGPGHVASCSETQAGRWYGGPAGFLQRPQPPWALLCPRTRGPQTLFPTHIPRPRFLPPPAPSPPPSWDATLPLTGPGLRPRSQGPCLFPARPQQPTHS